MLWDDHCSERQTLLRETKQICQKLQCWFYLSKPIEMTKMSHSLNILILILHWGRNPVRISKDMIRIGQKAAGLSINAENQVKWFCTNFIPTVGVCRGVLCLGLTVDPACWPTIRSTLLPEKPVSSPPPTALDYIHGKN